MTDNKLYLDVVNTETMQDEALDNLNYDIVRAEQLTYKALGRIELFKEQEQLTSEQMSRLSMKQINLEEKLRIKKAEQVGKQVQQITN